MARVVAVEQERAQGVARVAIDAVVDLQPAAADAGTAGVLAPVRSSSHMPGREVPQRNGALPSGTGCRSENAIRSLRTRPKDWHGSGEGGEATADALRQEGDVLVVGQEHEPMTLEVQRSSC